MRLRGNFLWAYVHTPLSLVEPDGIVDYRVMRLLEEEMFAHSKHPLAPEIARWMHDIRLRASGDPWGGYVQDVIENSYPWDHPDVVEPPGFEASDYDAIRRQAVTYILELGGLGAAPVTGE